MHPVRAGYIFEFKCIRPLYFDMAKTEKQRQRTWRDLINETLDIEVLAKVRHCANTGLVLGTESFREQVQRLRN